MIPKEKLQTDTERLVQKLQKWNILIPQNSTEPKLMVVPGSFSHVQHVASFFNNKLTAPILLLAEITFACDLNCPHCATLSVKTRSPDELTTNEWKSLIDELSALHVFTLTFTGGEPLLRPDLEDLIEYATEGGVYTTIDTSAHDMTEERIQSLLSAGLRGAQISLDGADAKTHDKFRGCKGLYDHIMRILPILIDSRIALQISSILTRVNLDQIPVIMEKLDEMGIKRYNLMRLLSSGRGACSNFLSPEPNECVAAMQGIFEKERQLKRLFVFYPSLPAAYYKESIGLDKYEQLKHEGKIGSCAAGITTCVISPTGDVMPCDVSGQISLGNIKKTSLKEVWENSEIFNDLRIMHKKDQKPCRNCKLNDICMGGCKALSSQVGGGKHLYVADPECVRCFEAFRPQLEMS